MSSIPSVVFYCAFCLQVLHPFFSMVTNYYLKKQYSSEILPTPSTPITNDNIRSNIIDIISQYDFLTMS
jgi:ABC-type phosphate transport system permease subunit